MNVNQIRDFGSCGKALAWAVVEQAIIDFRSTNNPKEIDDISTFLFDFLPSEYYQKICDLLGIYYE